MIRRLSFVLCRPGIGRVADQSKTRDTEDLVAKIKTRYGKLDILFINASVSCVSNIESAMEDVFDYVGNVNVIANTKLKQ